MERLSINPQLELDFRPSNLKITNQYYDKYAFVSRILDENPHIIDIAHRDLRNPLRYAISKGPGRRSCRYTSDNVLRILLCQRIEGASLRQIIIRIDDSNFLRRFVRLYDQPMMDFTTFDKLKNSIRPQTWHEINQALTDFAVKKNRISSKELRMDTTAVETNIHYPTDSSLLWDTYRVLARLISDTREIAGDLVGNKRLHIKRVKRYRQKIFRMAGKKRRSEKKLKMLYRRLIQAVEGVLAWSDSIVRLLKTAIKDRRIGFPNDLLAGTLSDEISETAALGKQVVDQARRRVLQGESVPNEEKLFSIFEPHTELLKRGKAGKDIEFGHMIEIEQVREKFITGYEVFKSKPVEHRIVKDAIARHERNFGCPPEELAADKGYYESMAAIEELSKTVKVVSIAKKGRRTQAEAEREHSQAFRYAQKFRAGVEGSIAFLKGILGLARCLDKGWEHFVCTVASTIFSHNLLILARSGTDPSG